MSVGGVATVGLIVKEYLKNHRNLASTDIAKMLISEHPGSFQSIELARSAVRYYRGTNGGKLRSALPPENYIPKFTAPEADGKPDDVYTFGDGPIMYASDVHLPFHDPDALEIMVEYAATNGIKTMAMWGDWLDFYGISRFIRDPSARDIAGEVEMFKKVLRDMQSALPRVKFVFKEGNHEARWDHYLMTQAPEVFKFSEVRLKNILGLEESDVDFVSSMQVAKFKQLHLIHGHEYVYGVTMPVNPARGLYLRAKKSAICGHHHQSSEHSEKDIADGVTTTWSVGCLCGLKPRYLPLNRWNHGFAVISGEEDQFEVTNHRIINYRLV